MKLAELESLATDRIHEAKNKKWDDQLTDLFGTGLWRDALKGPDIKRLTVQILELYKAQLKRIPGVRFVWSFAMRGGTDSLNYHLVFASKHPLGLEKMKEAMMSIDKTGSYTFSDAHVGQHVLFRENDAAVYAPALFEEFAGQIVSLEKVNIYALNETPLLNAKAMLAILETQHRVDVQVKLGESRRSGTFPEDKIDSLHFQKRGETLTQGTLL